VAQVRTTRPNDGLDVGTDAPERHVDRGASRQPGDPGTSLIGLLTQVDRGLGEWLVLSGCRGFKGCEQAVDLLEGCDNAGETGFAVAV
jgi:hypothetical protein